MAGSPWTNQAVSLIVLTEQTTGFSGIFGYSPTVGAGNLIFSLSAAAGTDPYGNAYPAGLSLTSGSISGLTISGSTFEGTDFIINSSGEFFYSSTPAAGNLVASVAPAAGADAFGNNYLAGASSYGSGFASQLLDGALFFLSGTLAGGWTQLGGLGTDGSGDLVSTFTGSMLLAGPLETSSGAGISGGLTVDTINGSDQTSTATGAPVTSGPNGGVFAGHTHDFAGHTHTI